jgi:hypothetical protein
LVFDETGPDWFRTLEIVLLDTFAILAISLIVTFAISLFNLVEPVL